MGRKEELARLMKRLGPNQLRKADALPPGYTVHRSVLGTYRWRFEVDGVEPDGQASNWSKEEAEAAAHRHAKP